MKELKTIIKAENATAVDFGKFESLGDFVLELGPEVKIPGKMFGGAAVGLQVASSRFSSLHLAQRQVSCIHTRTMRNYTSILSEKVEW